MEGMWRIAIAEKSQDEQDEQMNQGNMWQMAKRGYYPMIKNGDEIMMNKVQGKMTKECI
jgi:hypothetical protein